VGYCGDGDCDPNAEIPEDCISCPSDCGTPEICDDDSEVDEDCDGASNCSDYECRNFQHCLDECQNYDKKTCENMPSCKWNKANRECEPIADDN
jgi:hypothetical protein